MALRRLEEEEVILLKELRQTLQNAIVEERSDSREVASTHSSFISEVFLKS